MLHIVDRLTLLAYIALVPAVEIRNVKYQKHENTNIRIPSKLNSLVTRSLIECAVLCEEINKCLSFNFNSNSSCELSECRPDDQSNINISGWNIYMKHQDKCWPSDFHGVIKDGVCYFWNEQAKRNWVASRDDCRAHGAELVCIESEIENEFLAETVPGAPSWMGINDFETQNEYTCNGRKPSYTKPWNSVDPKINHCAYLLNRNTYLLWFIGRCWAKRSYICEKQLY